MPKFFLNWCALFSQPVEKIDFAPIIEKIVHANNICIFEEFFSQLVSTFFSTGQEN